MFVRKGSTESENCLLFEEFLRENFLKYCVFSFLQTELYLFFTHFTAKKFSLEGNFKYLCLHLDLFILAFLRCFVIKMAPLLRTNFFFRVA